MLHKTPHIHWNRLIYQYMKIGQARKALCFYTEMRQQGIIPNSHTFVAALKACSILEDLQAGKEIHTSVNDSGYQTHLFVANTLLDMYAKCGSIVHARQVFDEMLHRDVVSWNAMITGYAQRGEQELGLELYERMQNEGFRPNNRTFVAVLQACSRLAAREEGKSNGELIKVECLAKGRDIHSQVVMNGFDADIFLANTLVDMYANCGSILDASLVFEKIPHSNVVSWTTIIMGYSRMEEGEAALQLYARMQHEGFVPNGHTFVAALKACSSLAGKEKGKEVDGELVKVRCLEKVSSIHYHAVMNGFERDIYVANTLVDVYAKCGSMVNASRVFEKMNIHDVISWTAIIGGYAQQEKGELALQLYELMQHEGFAPDAHTFIAALKACGSLAVREEGQVSDGELVKIECLKKGRAIHSQVAKSMCELDLFVASALIDMYAKCRSMSDANRVFENMLHRDVVLWTAIINGYAQIEKGEEALQLYARMKNEGFTPNAHTFVAALMACSSLASLENGREIHTEICRFGVEDDIFVANCLLDMYAKCGSMIDAQRLFDGLPVKDIVGWSALIAGYSGQGDSGSVFVTFERMVQEGVQPGAVTFLSVLTACNHTGLVDKGQSYFQSMCTDYGITPNNEHYCCMGDLLGRAGQLDKSLSMLMTMPFKHNMVTWMTILSACQKWNNVEVGQRVFECVMCLDAKHFPVYVQMTNIYTSANLWEESTKIHEMGMKARASRAQLVIGKGAPMQHFSAFGDA